MKPHNNPQIELLTKSVTERSVQLTKLKPVTKLEEGRTSRWCAWCALTKLSHGNQKYCSRLCSDSAMAWAHPQSEHGLGMLLIRQGYLCAGCQHDYSPEAQKLKDSRPEYYSDLDFLSEFDWGFVKRLKERMPRELRLEVDHVIPIYKGGTSLGLDNHQALCNSCHKAKTKIDNTGPRKKK